MSTQNQSSIVIGEGWAALGAVGFLARSGKSVIWISGSGSRISSPMPGVDASESENGGLLWGKLAEAYGISAGSYSEGSFLREFRNKAFREPVWMKAPSPEGRIDARNELLWSPERMIAPAFEGRFELSLAEIEDQLREKILELPNVRKITGVPVQSLQSEDGKVKSVTIASGEVLAAETVFFADRWNTIATIAGIPKGQTFTRKREPVGVLQAAFTHGVATVSSVQEGFFGVLPREAGETTERHVWGYFTSEGTRSYWTICLSSEEVEDNHAIAKKLRRMKNCLDKMFAGSSLIPEGPEGPEGKADFLSNVKSELVRFEENSLFSEGEDPREAITIKDLQGIFFLTDGYGPSSALRQVEAALSAAGISLPEVGSDQTDAPEASV